MVRAGVVNHPSEWEFCGYHELQSIPERKRVIDYTCLIKLLKLNSYNDLITTHQKLINIELDKENLTREEKWTINLAVGSLSFVDGVKAKLGVKGQYRQISGEKESWGIREDVFC